MGHISQEDDRQHEHQDRADDPVLQKGDAQDLPVAEDIPKLLVADFCQGRIHHQDQADRNGDIGRADRDSLIESLHPCRKEIAQADTNCHCQEYPQGKKTIQKRQAFGLRIHHSFIHFIPPPNIRNDAYRYALPKKVPFLFGNHNYFLIWCKITRQLAASVGDLLLVKGIENLLALAP